MGSESISLLAALFLVDSASAAFAALAASPAADADTERTSPVAAKSAEHLMNSRLFTSAFSFRFPFRSFLHLRSPQHESETDFRTCERRDFGCSFPGRDPGIHGINENFLVDELLVSAKIFTQAIIDLCK